MIDDESGLLSLRLDQGRHLVVLFPEARLATSFGLDRYDDYTNLWLRAAVTS